MNEPKEPERHWDSEAYNDQTILYRIADLLEEIRRPAEEAAQVIRWPNFVILSRAEFDALVEHLRNCEKGCPLLEEVNKLGRMPSEDKKVPQKGRD